MIIKANRGFGPGFCEISAKFGCGIHVHVEDLQKQNNIHNQKLNTFTSTHNTFTKIISA